MGRPPAVCSWLCLIKPRKKPLGILSYPARSIAGGGDASGLAMAKGRGAYGAVGAPEKGFPR